MVVTSWSASYIHSLEVLNPPILEDKCHKIITYDENMLFCHIMSCELNGHFQYSVLFVLLDIVLVPAWSTKFGFGPCLTLIFSCNPGVLDWVSRGFLWRDTSNLSSFLKFFFHPLPLSLVATFVPLVLPMNLIGKIPWIDGLTDQVSSGDF